MSTSSQPPIQPPIDAAHPQNAPGAKPSESPSDPSRHLEIPPSPPPHKETCTCRPDQTPWWKDFLQVVAVAAALGVALIYWRQLGTMQGQLIQMKGSGEQTDKLLCLYENQLTVMQNQSLETRKFANATLDQAMTAMQEQAAQFSMKLLEPVTDPDTRQINMRFDFRNVGKTSAVVFSGDVMAVAVPRYSDPAFTYPENRAARLHGKTFLAGQGINDGIPPPKKITVPIWRIDGTRVIADQAYNSSFAAGKIDLMLYGKVRFNDVFGIPHWQQFCIVNEVLLPENTQRPEHPKCADYNQQDRVSYSLSEKNSAAPLPSAPIKNCDALSK
jgi:hypothetical protein